MRRTPHRRTDAILVGYPAWSYPKGHRCFFAALTPMHEHRRTPVIRRALLCAVPLAALSGCGQRSTPISARDAVAHYTQVVDALINAMNTVRSLTWEGGATALQPVEPCADEYHPGRWEADDPLYPVPGDGMDWEPWRTALDPVLEEWGFSKLDREKRKGAWLVRRATDQHGATLELTDHGILTITGARVSDADCG